MGEERRKPMTAADVLEKYPEHEKLNKVHKESQAIGQFLDTGGYVLAEYRKFDEYEQEQLVPVVRSIPAILADYFEINQDTIEAEKRQMLDEMREGNRG